MMMTKIVDFSVHVKRFPENESYEVALLLIKNGQPDKFEKINCQTLLEVFEKTSEFEKKYLHQFQNAIEYQHVSWRELAQQNKVQGIKK